MFLCTLLYVHFSIAIILMGKRELVALLNLSSWCLVMVEWRFLAVSWGCLWFVIVVFPDHTHLLFLVCGYILGLRGVVYCFWVTLTLAFGLALRKYMKTQVPRNVSETFVFGCMKVCFNVTFQKRFT